MEIATPFEADKFEKEPVFEPACAPQKVVATTFPMTFMVDVAFARVRVFANMLVVVNAFAAYKLFDRERLARFATEMTFRVPTLATEATKLVVKEDRLETCMTFRVPTLAVVTARVERFEMVPTFRVPTLATEATKLVVVTEFET